MLKEDNDMINLLSGGVKLTPNLVTRGTFARDCMWVPDERFVL